MADVSVRPAGGSDVVGIGEVQARAWTSGYAGLLGPDLVASFSPQTLAEAWRPSVLRPPSRRHHVVVACEGTDVVGFAAAAPSDDPDADAGDGELVAFAVDPGHVHAGHGSRLLAAATDLMRESGLTAVVAWVPSTDTAQRGFLAAAGLEPDGARREVEAPDGRRMTQIRMAAGLGPAG